jgi:hypothetical protein
MMRRRAGLAALFGLWAAPAAAASTRRRRRSNTAVVLAPREFGARAPVPDRTIEPPAQAPGNGQAFGPAILQRSLPGRSPAEGPAPTVLEDQLFKPAPGARLRLPFSF